MPRLLRSPYRDLQRADAQSELRILDAAAELQRRYGAQALPNYIISNANGVSDVLEAGAAAQGSRA